MKMIGLMSLTQYRDQVRKYFEQHEVQIYSELEVNGHTSDTIKQFGWWVFDEESAIQSVLFFFIVTDDKADDIIAGVADLATKFDPNHPPRAFQLNVEKLV
jgi:septin family protein